MKKTTVYLLFFFLLCGFSTAKTIEITKNKISDVTFFANFTLSTTKGVTQVSPLIAVSGSGNLSITALQLANPALSYQTEVKKGLKTIKWALNFTKIPQLTANKLTAVYLDFPNDGGQAVGTPNRIFRIYQDGLVINFDDLRRAGFAVNWLNSTRLEISNLTENIRASSLLLDPTIVYSCTNLLTSGEYEMNQSISCDETGVYISNDSIVLDCKNFEINYANGLNSYGIYASYLSNITIKNCRLTDAGIWGSSGGILLDWGLGTNITIQNVTSYGLSDTTHGFWFANQQEVNLTDSRAYVLGYWSHGVYLQEAAGITNIENSYFEKQTGWGYGIYNDISFNIHIKNTIINITTAEGSGVNFYSNSTFSNSAIYTIGETYETWAAEFYGGETAGTTFNNSKISATGAVQACITVKGGNKNHLIENTTLDCPQILQMTMVEGGCGNITFLNSTWDRAKANLTNECNASVKVGWYGHVNTTANATVNVTNIFGQNEFYANATTNGKTNTISIIQYLINATHTISDYGNHSIIITRQGYYSANTSKNTTTPFYYSLLLGINQTSATGTTIIYLDALNGSMLPLIVAMGLISLIFAFLYYSTDKTNTIFRLTFLTFTILSVVMLTWISYASLDTTTTVYTYNSIGEATGSNVITNSNPSVNLSFQTYLEFINYLPYIIFAAFVLIALYNLLLMYNQKYQGAS